MIQGFWMAFLDISRASNNPYGPIGQPSEYFYEQPMSYNQQMQPGYYTYPQYHNNMWSPQYHLPQEYFQPHFVNNERSEIIDINTYASNMNLLRKVIGDCEFVSLKMETGEFVKNSAERSLIQLKAAAEFYSVLRIGLTANNFVEGQLEQTEWTFYIREERINCEGIKDDAINIHREQGKALGQNGFPWEAFFKSSINLLGTEEPSPNQKQQGGYARKLPEKIYPLQKFLEELLIGKPLVASVADFMYLFKLLGYEIPSNHSELVVLLTNKRLIAFEFQLSETAQDPAAFSKKLGEQFSFTILKGSNDFKCIETLKNCFAKARIQTQYSNIGTKKLSASNEATKPAANCEIKSNNQAQKPSAVTKVQKQSSNVERKDRMPAARGEANFSSVINEGKMATAIKNTEAQKEPAVNVKIVSIIESKKRSAGSEATKRNSSIINNVNVNNNGQSPSVENDIKKPAVSSEANIQNGSLPFLQSKIEVVKKFEVVPKENKKVSEQPKPAVDRICHPVPEKQIEEKNASCAPNSNQPQIKSDQSPKRELKKNIKDKFQTANKTTVNSTANHVETKHFSSDESSKEAKKARAETTPSKNTLKESSISAIAHKQILSNPNHSASSTNAQTSKRKNKKPNNKF